MRFGISTLSLVALVAGCASTRPIPESQSIPVPRGLNEQNVEIAILSALLVQPPPGIYDPRAIVPKEQYDQLVWNYYVTSAGNRGWIVKSREPGIVTAAISRPQYELKI